MSPTNAESGPGAYGAAMSQSEPAPTVAGVALTNLDQPLFDEAGATKRDLVGYLDQMADRLIAHLRDRPLSVIRVRPGQAPFMQKNLPKYTPEWVPSVSMWADTAKREIRYALANDRRTLVWFANQRAVEYHPTLVLRGSLGPADPPGARPGPAADRGWSRRLRPGCPGRPADQAGARRHGPGCGSAKTSGAKGLHVFVPLDGPPGWRMWPPPPARSRPGPNGSTPSSPPPPSSARIATARCSSTRPDPAARRWSAPTVRASVRAYPCPSRSTWDDLDSVTPADFTVRHRARPARRARQLGRPDAGAAGPLPADLVAEGHEIPIARVQAMHEGKRRARAARAEE